MLRAGTACFEAMTARFALRAKRVCVLCGNGKNAGDGFVIARLLYAYGAAASILLCDKDPTIEEPLEYYRQAVSSGVPVRHFDGALPEADYYVDCLFGIGFHGEARAPFDAVFAAVNKASGTVIAVDTPSGTDATTGAVCREAICVDYTIAISTLKYAHVLPPSNACCGEITTVNIGIPEDCYRGDYVQTIEHEAVRALFPKRDKNANKGTFGHQLNICGSYHMFGAAVIATQAALRSGAGLVKLCVPQSAYPLVAAHLTQPIFEPCAENSDKTFSAGAFGVIGGDMEWASSIVLGCGIGVNDDTADLVAQVLQKATVPVILDADGINCLKERISIIKEIKAPVVLTPHPGEMARLLSKSVAEIQADRIGIAKRFAEEYGVVLVLKGANTVVTDGESVFVNMTGNPSMAMGGTGDMLSGMIGAFAAQGLRPFDAAKAGVYIHGLCGDAAAKQYSQRGMLVCDMTEQLGALMSEFE